MIDGGINSPAVFETQLKEIDEELMRVNESGLDQLKLFGPHPRSVVSETTNLDAKPLSESHDKQFPTRVSNHPTQLQVLPT